MGSYWRLGREEGSPSNQESSFCEEQCEANPLGWGQSEDPNIAFFGARVL